MTYKVLIVDDSVENINILSGILSSIYQIMATTNGPMALKICEKQSPDIVLLDIEMPGMNGYEVCKRLKENPLTTDIPVIFVTAKEKVLDEAKGFALGAADYVTKPVSPLTVISRVKTQIALNNQQKELRKLVQEQTEEIRHTRQELVKRLGKAVEFKDKSTGYHIDRVTRYSFVIGRSYGLDEIQLELLVNAAPMHDIGKIGVPEAIIQKEGILTSEEYNEIKKHCEIGYEILGTDKEGIIGTAKIIALEHHEKWDGTGYPNHKKGKNIHLFSRIVAVADVFDALTTKRSYKKKWTNDEAMELITSEQNKHFDPQVVQAFLSVLHEIYQIQEELSDQNG